MGNHHTSTFLRLLHKGASLCCFRDSASVTYGGMLPSDLTLSALRFILSAKSRQSCKQDCEPVDFCNSLFLSLGQRSLCDTTPIYNRSNRSAELHSSPYLIGKSAAELVSRANSAMLMGRQGCSTLWPSEILYKFVYDKQGGLRRSYRVETSNCDLSALILCNI